VSLSLPPDTATVAAAAQAVQTIAPDNAISKG
jgi:hypothetical protein